MKKARQKTPIGENLLTLRHRMKMTQSEFIDMFFKDEEGTPLLSVAKLSNLETKGNRDEEMLAEKVAGKLGEEELAGLIRVYRGRADRLLAPGPQLSYGQEEVPEGIADGAFLI